MMWAGGVAGYVFMHTYLGVHEGVEQAKAPHAQCTGKPTHKHGKFSSRRKVKITGPKSQPSDAR